MAGSICWKAIEAVQSDYFNELAQQECSESGQTSHDASSIAHSDRRTADRPGAGTIRDVEKEARDG